jgi:hypothetical protein
MIDSVRDGMSEGTAFCLKKKEDVCQCRRCKRRRYMECFDNIEEHIVASSLNTFHLSGE